MQIIDAVQGSQEWLDIRARYFTASEAPAMLGGSPYKTRQALLREKSTGHTEDVDANKQRLFDRGHESEAIARPLAEAIIGEDLFPATCAEVIEGLHLLSSHDGLTMDEQTNWENKLDNERLRAMIATGDLDAGYWPQVEQQMAVTGATRTLFTICDGEKITGHLWYESKPERRAQLIAGWKQFAEDLANYQHVEPAQVATAAPIRELPALSIEITGAVLSSNLVAWKEIVTERIAGINTNLQTDQDFADADQMVKFLDDGEKRIDLVKSQAQANAADIDMVFRALDEIKASMKAKRLELDKLVTKRKESIRAEIAEEAAAKLRTHINTLNVRLGMPLPPIPANFAVVMKNKRTVASLRDAVDTELARLKMAASEIADKIQINLIALAAVGTHAFLFNDRAALVLKDADDLALVIKSRIQDHQAAEAKRQEEEREKIRAEEEEKAAAKVKAEQEEAERQRKADTPVLSEKSVADAKARVFVDSISDTAPAAAPAVTLHDVATATAREVFKPAEPAHMGMTGSGRVLLDEIDDILRGLTLADLIKVRDFAAQVASQREKAAA